MRIRYAECANQFYVAATVSFEQCHLLAGPQMTEYYIGRAIAHRLYVGGEATGMAQFLDRWV